MKYKYQEAIFSGLMLLGCLFLLAHTYAEQYQALLTGDDVLTPIFYPRLLIALLVLITAGMLGKALRLPESISINFNAKQVVYGFALMAAMLVLLLCFGFAAGTAPFVYCFALFLGYKDKVKALAAAIVIPSLLYVIFDKGLNLIFPTPVWNFF